MTMLAEGWIRMEERQPEKYGRYRVLRRRPGGLEADELLWNGGSFVTERGSLTSAVDAWQENSAEEPGETLAETHQARETRVLSLADYEARIHLYKEQIGTGYIGIGRTLNEAKEAGVVPHGEWEAWVTRTTGLTARQAQRCMQAATEIRDGSALAQLEMSKALMLLSSGLDEEKREEVAEKAAAEGATVRQLRAEIDRVKEETRAWADEHIRKARAEAEAQRQAREAENAENAETVKALKLQVVKETGTAAEIREALRKAETERDQMAGQMKAMDEAWRGRMDAEVGKAYQRGSDDGSREAERHNASLRDALKHSREKAEQLSAELDKAKEAAEHGYDDGYNVGQLEMAGKYREARNQAEQLMDERDALRRQVQAMEDGTEAAELRAAHKEALAAKSREIEELRAELEAAEAREAKRAAELSAMRKERTQAGMDAARGIGAQALGAVDLAAAVRDFIGRAGVLPQMGKMISGMSAKERETILANVETVGKWFHDSLAALGVVKADARIQ